MTRSILVIDDDRKLTELLVEYLQRFELEVVSAASPELGMKLLHKRKPDLVVLDVMLPGKSGFEVLKEIRAESNVPVIMLTARGEVTDRIVGLELGADDYLAKPFEPRELVARIQTVLRRGGEAASGKVRHVVGDLVVDTETRAATLKGETVELSTSEFEVLLLFVTHPGKAFTRDQIIDRLRGTDWAADSRAVDVLVSRIRQKLKDDPKTPTFLKTIWGTGYMFIGGARR